MPHNPRTAVLHSHVQATSNVWKKHKRECEMCNATSAMYGTAHQGCIKGANAQEEFRIASGRLTDDMFN